MSRKLTRGQRAIRWIEAYCFVPEGRDVGKPLRLRPWQKKIIRGLYDTPTRTGIISFARKNAKTALAACLNLLHLCGPEAVPNSQLRSTAQSREQAAVLFDLAAKMVRMSVDLDKVVEVKDSTKRLVCPELGTEYRALSSEDRTVHGMSPVFAVHDELGQVRGPRSALYEAVETGMGAHERPMSIIISTQAPTDADLLSVLMDDAASGKDPQTKLFLYTAPVELDPFSVKAQKAANPALGDFLNRDEVAALAAKAKRMPSFEASYRNLQLNQRVNQNSPFVPPAVWRDCGGAVEEEAFRIGPVYAGLDLSARNDLTALVYIAPDHEGRWHSRAEFFAPREGLRDRADRDRVPYDVWADQGWLTATPGASVDYGWVADRLIALADEHELKVVKFDRWRIDVLEAEIKRRGVELPLEPHGQGYRDMAPALDTLESEMLQGRLRHGDNPILTNHAANAIAVADPAGNRKLDKSKSYGRIDGMVALAMAMNGASARKPKRRSIYETGVH